MSRHRATKDDIRSVVPRRGASANATTKNGTGKPWWKPPLTNGVWLLAFIFIMMVLWLGGCAGALLLVRAA